MLAPTPVQGRRGPSVGLYTSEETRHSSQIARASISTFPSFWLIEDKSLEEPRWEDR